MNSPCDGFGTLGSNGFINYYQACWFTNDTTETSIYFDGYAKAPYAYRDTEWISYDNEESLAYKVKLFLIKKNKYNCFIKILNILNNFRRNISLPKNFREQWFFP